MSRQVKTVFRCQQCGAGAPRWAGRCPGCNQWNTLVEERRREHSAANGAAGVPAPVPIGKVDGADGCPRPTGIAELDRVLGGGLVPGSATLVGGEPGIGKSTLLLQVLHSLSAAGARCLLVSGEESPQQVRLRAERLEAFSPDLWLLAETNLVAIEAAVDEMRPEYLVVDSVQTLFDPELGSAPGSVGQVRDCAARLVQMAKRLGVATVLVGHVTKEGSLAGPRVLEHVVDTVLAFEGDRHHALRMLRALKHRFGPTNEIGLFEMTEGGLAGVADPGQLFLADRQPGVAGSAVVPAVEGHRPLLVELQALVAPTRAPVPRRSAQGLDPGRLALLVAVLHRRLDLDLSQADVFALAVGGVRVVEPGADLALALALVSAATGAPLPPDLVACGEVGLGGELRQVGQTRRRLAEAARLGFRRALVPASAMEAGVGIELVPAANLAEARRLATGGCPAS
jgi:DNA repair protein RadA/Sms